MKKDVNKNKKLWKKRLILAVIVVLFYYLNEKFQVFSIHNPTCLFIIFSFFIIISITDILVSKVLKIK
jgi:hypothetical protein